jgi:pimeloyl-ACP methyl ester carboxylesterase
MFVNIGGEAAASELDISAGSGSPYNNAQAFNAMLFTLEHRYFGQSLPTKNYCTRDSMRWLTTQQALADLANWIPAMKKKYNLGDSPVICFGGSYSGSLAAWFRLKYPDIATGCVASSAPLVAREDVSGYDKIVAKALDYWSPGCTDKVAQGFAKLQKVLKSPDRGEQLSSIM